ncbi:GNAT family N-acetyltransferase [Desulfosporosinus sp. FKA]|uniref:GNAT family N-acetyltransferase n=1 Tax=Desulfosporosinus sp. FKA TaxID=1969834 RepID=UPI000B49ACCB|nr:GNAT family N-acetyltransferase [Desulfosporosinus sp. FKA]
MLIRQATEQDLLSIVDLLQAMDGEEKIDYGEAVTIWRKMKEYPYYKVFVVADSDQIIAACSLIILENLGHRGAKLALAESVIVAANYRGSGIGSMLMHFIMDEAKEGNCYKLMLSSNKKRLQAHAFYQKQGFQQHGISFAVELNQY